jgi:hypothetical protein
MFKGVYMNRVAPVLLAGVTGCFFSVMGYSASAPITFPYVIRVALESPHQVGGFDKDRQAIVAKQGEKGAVLFGPYLELDAGKYSAAFELETGGASGKVIGKVDVSAFSIEKPDNPVSQADIVVSSKKQRVVLDFEAVTGKKYEFRVWTNGVGGISVRDVTISKK